MFRLAPWTTIAVLSLIASCCFVASCLAGLSVPSEARVTCADDVDCPSTLVCAGGLCADPSGPCFVQGSNTPVGDGTACDDGGDEGGEHCVAGRCVAPYCGDGVVRFDDGEECDPGIGGAADPSCRVDCTQPFCGDGIVDVSESCERDDTDCAACSLTCTRPVADCDGAERGCECVTNGVLEGDFIPFAAAFSGETLWLVRSPPDIATYSLSHVPATGGAVTDVEVINVGQFARAPEGTLYAFVSGTITSRLLELDETNATEVLQMPRGQGFVGFDVTEDAFIGSSPVGLQKRDRATLELTPISEACAQAVHVVVCDDVAICSDQDALTVDLVHLDDGSSEQLASSELAITSGCSPTYGVVWYDGAVLWQRVEGGEPIALVSFVTDPQKIAFQATILDVDGELWFSGGRETLQTYRFLPATRATAGVGAGWLYDEHEGNVVIAYVGADTERSSIETFRRAR